MKQKTLNKLKKLEQKRQNRVLKNLRGLIVSATTGPKPEPKQIKVSRASFFTPGAKRPPYPSLAFREMVEKNEEILRLKELIRKHDQKRKLSSPELKQAVQKRRLELLAEIKRKSSLLRASQDKFGGNNILATSDENNILKGARLKF